MRLSERHIISKNNEMFREIDANLFLSKNLFNAANYVVRQVFINTSILKEEGKVKHATWVRYHELDKMMRQTKNSDFLALPQKVSQHVLKQVDRNWKSFFEAIKTYGISPDSFTGRPCLPKYKEKQTGRNLLIYTIQAISKTQLKKGIVKLSGTNIEIKTKQKNINQARVIPKHGCCVIEIIYEKEVKDLKLDKNKIAGIDLGLNNLLTVTSNQKSVAPMVINGRIVKSINQYYNKKKAKLMSFVGDKGKSNRVNRVTLKRNNKIDYLMHVASRILVNHLISNDIGTLVIGNNKQWKTEINIGKKNNQNFVSVPHSKLIHMVTYKCYLVGIDVKIIEESYTSKCSFIDFEEIKKHEEYLGKRKHRGLFISKKGTKINADCNGSGNIIRKVFPNAFDGYGIEGVVVHPVRVHPYKKVA